LHEERQMNRRRRRQLAFHDFPGGFSGARIFSDNRWVRLAQIIPWDLVDKKYAENFVGKKAGNPAIESRMAFGSLVIKEELHLSDEDTVTMIGENPHCQYFIGMEEFMDKAPFDASKMTAFRKRFSPEAMAEINEAIIAAQKKDPPPPEENGDDDSKDNNDGTLILDATCAPADIHFPTDAGVLNDARELTEQLIDELFESSTKTEKPRTYRQKARKNYLLLVRNKRPGKNLIRKTRKSQLQYLRRNLGHIEVLADSHDLSARQRSKLVVLHEVHRQQREMYDNKCHKVEDRIVSVFQPWVRPIVRGKLTAKTEFGAKIALSLEDG